MIASEANMEEQKSPKRNVLLRVVQSKWCWITFVALALLAAAILISLPYGIDYAAEQWLLSHGLEVARVEDVDFNPFTGMLVLRNLQAKIGKSQMLHVPEASMQIHWRPFFKRRAHIEKLSIKDTTVIIDHDKKGHWRVGGLALVAAETVTEQPSESTWGFGLNKIEILNSHVEHVLGGMKVKVTVEKATMSRVRTWDKKQAAHLDFEGKINEAKLGVKADFFPFATLPSVTGSVKLETLSLQDFNELTEPYLRGLQGELSMNSSLAVKKENNRNISFSQDGTISLKHIKVPKEGVDIAARDMEWDGSIGIKTSGVSAQGKLKGAHLAVRSMQEGLNLHAGELVLAGQLDYGKKNQRGFLQTAGDLGLRHVWVDDMRRELRLIDMGALNLKNISARGPEQMKVSEVQVERLHLIQRLQDSQQAGDEPSLFSASGATLQDVELAEARRLSIELLELSGVSFLLRRDSQGKWQPIGGLFLPVKESKRSEKGKSQQPLMVKIAQARIADQGLFRFEDRGVSPPFKTSLTISEAILTGLDSGKPEQASTVSLVGKIDEYTDVSMQGTVTPFTQRPGLDLTAKIDDFDLPNLSPYVVRLIGYKVKSGHLDTDMELQSLQGDLSGKCKFTISNAEVAPADAEIMEQFERQLKVPLPTALTVLKDSKNKIKLDVPITGDIFDPKFSFTDAFNQALVKGMTKAAVSYLKYIFQPYGAMITVVELGIMAGKKIAAVRLDPVFFDPGSDTISDNALPYLERVAELMKTRPQIRIKVCGLATEADKGARKETSGKKGSKQPTTQEKSPDAAEVETYPEQLQPLTVEEELGKLAQQRAAEIKGYLVKNHGIEDDRLLVCLPEYDAREKATPRVELLVP
jgi:outer membrane protein OmpA-like peptidoglycan-associated protein